jgi:hypothetical protein
VLTELTLPVRRGLWELGASPIFPARLVSQLGVFPSPVDIIILHPAGFVNSFLKKIFFIFLPKKA